MGEETPITNYASAFVGKQHKEQSSSSATRAHKLRILSLWVLLLILKVMGCIILQS